MEELIDNMIEYIYSWPESLRVMATTEELAITKREIRIEVTSFVHKVILERS